MCPVNLTFGAGEGLHERLRLESRRGDRVVSSFLPWRFIGWLYRHERGCCMHAGPTRALPSVRGFDYSALEPELTFLRRTDIRILLGFLEAPVVAQPFPTRILVSFGGFFALDGTGGPCTCRLLRFSQVTKMVVSFRLSFGLMHGNFVGPDGV